MVEDGVAAGDDDGAGHADGIEDLDYLTGDIVERTHVDDNLLPRTGWPGRTGKYQCSLIIINYF